MCKTYYRYRCWCEWFWKNDGSQWWFIEKWKQNKTFENELCDEVESIFKGNHIELENLNTISSGRNTRKNEIIDCDDENTTYFDNNKEIIEINDSSSENDNIFDLPSMNRSKRNNYHQKDSYNKHFHSRSNSREYRNKRNNYSSRSRSYSPESKKEKTPFLELNIFDDNYDGKYDK